MRKVFILLMLCIIACDGVLKSQTVIPYLPLNNNPSADAVDLSSFVPPPCDYTLMVQGSVGTEINVGQCIYTYTPVSSGIVRFVQRYGTVYVFEGNTYIKSIIPVEKINFPNLTAATDNSSTGTGIYSATNLFQNPGFETNQAISGSTTYFSDNTYWKVLTSDQLTSAQGSGSTTNIRKTALEGTYGLMFHSNALYLTQQIAAGKIKPDTYYKITYSVNWANSATPVFIPMLGTTQCSSTYGIYPAVTTTAIKGTWKTVTLWFKTSSDIDTQSAVWVTLQANAATISYMDRMTMVEAIGDIPQGITGVTSASIVNGTAYAPNIEYQNGQSMDMTSFILNPSFENGITSWTNNGMSSQTNSGLSIKESSTYVEKYVAMGSAAGSASVIQTISGLTNGKYTLSAAAMNIQQSASGSNVNSGNSQTGAYIKGNTEKTAITSMNNYSCDFFVVDGTATIGFVAESASGNWLACDNFRLQYKGLDASALKVYLQAQVDTAKVLLLKQMQNAISSTLNNTITTAETALANTSISTTELSNVSNQLIDAIDASRISISAFIDLQTQIIAASDLTNLKMQNAVKAELLAAISAGQVANANLDITSADLTSVTTRLKTAISSAQTYNSAYVSLQDVINQAHIAYGDGTGNSSNDLLIAINSADVVNNNMDISLDTINNATATLSNAILAYHISNATGIAPIVVTNPVCLRGATKAFGRSTIIGYSTADLLEHGFCWSTSPNPSVLDSRTTNYFSHNGYIYRMENLTPSTVYYVRAYALTKGYAVGYGGVIKVITIPKGTATYTYNNGGTADANKRISAALQGATNYRNDLTSIQGVKIKCTYGSGTPTADCSYGGTMRIGPNSSYQRTGTVLHEMAHATGVGTHSIWYGPGSPLRSGGSTGYWLGDRANMVERFFENSDAGSVYGDAIHVWSSGFSSTLKYGINGASEDNGSALLYTANSLLIEALGEDGLPPTGGFGLAYYAFNHNDGQKYYIKSEDTSTGRDSSFLMETTDGKVIYRMMTPDQAMVNDSAAWLLTFDPVKCYYTFKNASTGKYLTYLSSSINGISMTTRTAPLSNNYFMLMKGRKDVILGTSSNTYTTRGYWIVYNTNVKNPPTFMASSNGTTGAASFALTDDATTQRWLILSADDFTKIKQATSTDVKKIISSPAENNDNRIYTIDGRYLGVGDPNELRLPSGIYIWNHKKVAILK